MLFAGLPSIKSQCTVGLGLPRALQSSLPPVLFENSSLWGGSKTRSGPWPSRIPITPASNRITLKKSLQPSSQNQNNFQTNNVCVKWEVITLTYRWNKLLWVWYYFLLGNFSPSLGVVSQHCPNGRMELNTVRSRNVKHRTSDGSQCLRRRKIVSAPLWEPVNLRIIWKAYMICMLVPAANVKIAVFWV
jgi:hypothetical protein